MNEISFFCIFFLLEKKTGLRGVEKSYVAIIEVALPRVSFVLTEKNLIAAFIYLFAASAIAFVVGVDVDSKNRNDSSLCNTITY